MSSTTNNPGPDLLVLQQQLEQLQALLDAEFCALRDQDLDLLDRLVLNKESIIGELGEQSLESVIAEASRTANAASGTELQAQWQALTVLASNCRDLQKRNEILIDRKLSVVRTALSSLVAPTTPESVQTYTRQGKLSNRTSGTGRIL